jgi:hypothetical protein
VKSLMASVLRFFGLRKPPLDEGEIHEEALAIVRELTHIAQTHAYDREVVAAVERLAERAHRLLRVVQP